MIFPKNNNQGVAIPRAACGRLWQLILQLSCIRPDTSMISGRMQDNWVANRIAGFRIVKNRPDNQIATGYPVHPYLQHSSNYK